MADRTLRLCVSGEQVFTLRRNAPPQPVRVRVDWKRWFESEVDAPGWRCVPTLPEDPDRSIKSDAVIWLLFQTSSQYDLEPISLGSWPAPDFVISIVGPEDSGARPDWLDWQGMGAEAAPFWAVNYRDEAALLIQDWLRSAPRAPVDKALYAELSARFEVAYQAVARLVESIDERDARIAQLEDDVAQLELLRDLLLRELHRRGGPRKLTAKGVATAAISVLMTIGGLAQGTDAGFGLKDRALPQAGASTVAPMEQVTDAINTCRDLLAAAEDAAQ